MAEIAFEGASGQLRVLDIDGAKSSSRCPAPATDPTTEPPSELLAELPTESAADAATKPTNG